MKPHLEENINTPSGEQAKTMSKVKRAIDNFAGQITVNSDLEKEVGEFLLKKGISFMKDDSNLSKGKITFKLGYKKLKESYPINAFSDAQSKTFDRLDNILSKFKNLNRKYVPRKSIDGTDKVMLSKSGKDFVNIYKDGSFEILDDNGKVTARVRDINDFSDNDIGVIFKKELNIEESLKEDRVEDINQAGKKEGKDPQFDAAIKAIRAYWNYDMSLEQLHNTLLKIYNNDAKKAFTVFATYGDAARRSKDECLSENFGNGEWQEVASKTVEDSDGFLTDYVWYTDGDRHVFVFGDSDIYRPEDGEFDWEIDIVKGREAESDKEAQEWFDSYEGFADLNENIHVKVAKPEKDKIKAYSNTLKNAKKDGRDLTSDDQKVPLAKKESLKENFKDPYKHLQNWLSKNPIHNLKLDSFEKFREFLAKNVFNKKVEKLSEDEDYAIQEIWEDSSLYEGKENLKESLLKIGLFS